VESASFKFFFFFSGIDSRRRKNQRKGERKVVRIPEIDSSTPENEPNKRKKQKEKGKRSKSTRFRKDKERTPKKDDEVGGVKSTVPISHK
jgi:hypothetical protein